MDRDLATYEAFDGVELRLSSGRVVKSAALTVAEAVRFARPPITEEGLDVDGKLTEAALRTVGDHLAAFCARIGIADVPLSELGLEQVDDIALGATTVARGLEIACRQSIAGSVPDTVEGATAMEWILDEVPAEFGLDASAAEVFHVARRVRVALYRHMDWLLRRFFAVLTTSPEVRTMQIRAAPNSTQGSTI